MGGVVGGKGERALRGVRQQEARSTRPIFRPSLCCRLHFTSAAAAAAHAAHAGISQEAAAHSAVPPSPRQHLPPTFFMSALLPWPSAACAHITFAMPMALHCMPSLSR